MTMPTGGPENRKANVTVTADTSQYSQSVQGATRDTHGLISSLDVLGAKLTSLRQFAGKSLLHFAAADLTAMTVMTAQAGQFQKQLSVLDATATITHQSFNGFKADVENLSKNFPIARGEAAQLVTALSNVGIVGTKQIGDLSTTFVKLGAATGESVTGLATSLTQLSRQMGTTDAATIAKYANSLLTVSKNAGVSASGVLQFTQAITPAGRAAGLGMTQR